MPIKITEFFAMVLALAGPAPQEAPRELQLKVGEQIVAIGDSITSQGGYVRDIDAVLAQQYPDLKLPRILNAGFSGNKAEDLVARFHRDVIARKPAVVTINIGINDVWHRLKAPHQDEVLAKYVRNLALMVDDAQSAGTRVVLVAPSVISEDPSAEGNRRLALYVQAMKRVAADKKCCFVDLHAMFLEAIRRKPPGAGARWLTTDGVHMGPMGNGLMAVAILRALGVSDAKIAASTPPEGRGTFPTSGPASATSRPSPRGAARTSGG